MEGVGEVVEVMAAEQGSGGGGPWIGVGARLGGREEAQTSPGSPRRRRCTWSSLAPSESSSSLELYSAI